MRARGSFVFTVISAPPRPIEVILDIISDYWFSEQKVQKGIWWRQLFLFDAAPLDLITCPPNIKPVTLPLKWHFLPLINKKLAVVSPWGMMKFQFIEMGVKGLQSYVENECGGKASYRVSIAKTIESFVEANSSEVTTPLVLIDTSSLLRPLFEVSSVMFSIFAYNFLK